MHLSKYFLLAIFAALACGMASAQEVLEQARLKVYFLNTYLTIAEKACVEKYPDLQVPLALAREQFQARVVVEIELGKEFGKALAAKRGEDIEKMAERLARKDLANIGAVTNQSFQRQCDDLARDIKNRAHWSINDYLKEDFETHMDEVGNRQGLPCSFIPSRLKSIARRLVERGGQSLDSDRVLDLTIYADLFNLSEKVSNCLAGQARALEYGVVVGGELQEIREVVSSLQSTLMPDSESRAGKKDAIRLAAERLHKFLGELEGK